MFYNILRKILFSFEPETAHRIVSEILKFSNRFLLKGFTESFFQFHHDKLKRKLWNIEFPNIVGLAAGFDKSGELYPVLARLGFGFIECGTFTPLPQEGNPMPRLFRYPQEKIIINRMGFNNPGIEKARETFLNQKLTVPRGINIGKNKNTPLEKSLEDYCKCFESLYPFANYIVINVSSPNTPDLRDLQDSLILQELIRLLNQKKESLNISIPVLIKLAPDLTDNQLYTILDTYLQLKVDGVVLTNTTLKRPVDANKYEKGGLSGRFLRNLANEIIKKTYKYTNGKIPIIGVGGVFSGQDALEKIFFGASLVQIYTGYIYEGPFLPKKILMDILEFLEKENTSLTEITGIHSI